MTTEREKLFGNDLWVLGPKPVIDVAGNLDLVAPARRDLNLARGNDNIVQAMVLRLLVRKGELALLGWPNFGSRLHELIGEPNNERTRVKLMAFARDAINRDPRVAEVTNIEARPQERTTVRLLMDVLLIEETNPLNLVFDVNLGTL